MPLTEAGAGLLGALGNAGASVLNSAIGLVAANHGAYRQYKYNSKLQKQAAKLNYDYAQKTALNSPSWNRQGLVSAGYNPMLAVQNSTSGVNTSFTSNSSTGAPDYAGLGVGEMVSNASRIQEIKNQTSQTESINDKNYAEADEAKVRKAGLIEKLPFVSKQAKADYMKTEMESAKLENDIHYQNEYLNYLDNQLEVDARLREMGINADYRARIYGSDKAYNASTYASDVLERNNRRDNRLRRNTPQLPFGLRFPRGFYQPQWSEPFYDR